MKPLGLSLPLGHLGGAPIFRKEFPRLLTLNRTIKVWHPLEKGPPKDPLASRFQGPRNLQGGAWRDPTP